MISRAVARRRNRRAQRPVDLWKNCRCHRFAYSVAHDSIPTSLNQRDQPITEQKDAVIFVELRQVSLFVDLSKEDLEQLYRIRGERRTGDPRSRSCTQHPGALNERRLFVGSSEGVLQCTTWISSTQRS